MSEIQKWADKAMFEAEPMPSLEPTVTLISMNSDPLGDIASACMMYEGKVIRSLSEVNDAQRLHYWKQVQKTHLKAPLEFVDLHFLIEGVTRAFTHQMVRQRTAVYAQESMRFAVKENMVRETPLPPSLADLDHWDNRVMVWEETLQGIQDAYNHLINSGIPAEDARGLLPHQTTTRLHYKTNLRGLLDHAGNRLCTQAQFEWRVVFQKIMMEIADYDPRKPFAEKYSEDTSEWTPDMLPDRWQFEEIAGIFRPVCYELGHCPFQASFDRHCQIRDRVETFAQHGVPSSEWGKGAEVDQGEFIGPIDPAEWMMDPEAARQR